MMKTMTSKERLLAAIAGREVDKIPVSPRLGRYMSWKKFNSMDMIERYDFDLFVFGAGGLTTPFRDMRCECQDYGIEIKISESREQDKSRFERTFNTPAGPLKDVVVQADPGGIYGIHPSPEWLEPPVKDAGDVEKLRYILPDPQNVLPNFEKARKMENEIGDRGLLAYRPSMGVDEIVVDALGVEQALLLSIDDPSMIEKTLDIVDDWHIKIMKIFLESGAKIIFDPWYNFSLSVGWSPDFYNKTAIPRIRKHAEIIHSYGALDLFYDDGKIKQSLSSIVDAGVDIIQTLTLPPSGDIEYKWLAENFGGRVCLNGGVDTVLLRFGTPEEIEKTVAEAVEILAPAGKFILGISDSIPEETPEENVKAFFEAGRKYGKAVAEKLYS